MKTTLALRISLFLSPQVSIAVVPRRGLSRSQVWRYVIEKLGGRRDKGTLSFPRRGLSVLFPPLAVSPLSWLPASDGRWRPNGASLLATHCTGWVEVRRRSPKKRGPGGEGESWWGLNQPRRVEEATLPQFSSWVLRRRRHRVLRRDGARDENCEKVSGKFFEKGAN